MACTTCQDPNMSTPKRRTAGAGAATTKAATAEAPASKKAAAKKAGKAKTAVEPVQPAAPTKPKAWVSGSANPPPKA